jgi:dihydropyrimidinase
MKLIQGGVVVSAKDSFRADVLVDGGKIVAVEAGIEPKPDDEVVDAKGLLVFPGFIDAHTHLEMDNGVTVTADDFESGTRAAVAGGTTVVLDFATQDRGGTLADSLAAWLQKADGKCFCDYGFHMAVTDWNESVRAELPKMFEAGVTSFKLYMAYDALRLLDDQVLGVLRAMKELGGVAYCHCENGQVINLLIAEARAEHRLGPAEHPRCRPALLEAEAISRFAYLGELAGAPVGVVHLSSEAGLREALKARARGVKIFLETCPQYLTLDDRRYGEPGFDGAKYVCSPPLRKPSDVEALLDAVQEGAIDTIATDHCSYTLKQKAFGAGDFSKIPNGLPGIEHRPALIYSELVAKKLIGPEDMCRMLRQERSSAGSL